MRSRLPRRVAAVGVVLVAIALPLWLRVVWEGTAELQQADQALEAGDVPGEIMHLGRALRWRAPLASHDEVALERLWVIAQEHQAQGAAGRPTAMVAYREVRRGLLATRAWGIPHRERWSEANEQLAVLMSQQERQLGLEVAEPDGPSHRERLGREPGPDPTRGNLAALAFVGWIGCVVGFVVQGLDPRGRLLPRRALRWGFAALVLLVVWAVLLAVSHG